MARGTWQGGGTWQTSGGGGGLVLVVIVVALLIGSGAVTAAISALEVIAAVIACLAVAAVLGGIVLVVYRARSDRRRAVFAARPMVREGSAGHPELSNSYKPAIEPPRGEQHLHLHIHGVSADELAAALRRINHEE